MTNAARTVAAHGRWDKMNETDADVPSITGGEGPRIHQVDELVVEFTEHYGYTVQEQGLVLAEETGEACEEILKLNDGKVTKDNSDPDIRGEIGDVLYTVWTIAYLTGNDPVEALLETASKNARRMEDGRDA